MKVLLLSIFSVLNCGFAMASFDESASSLRDVLLIGNGVAGTISVIDGHSFQNLGNINAMPDLEARLHEIKSNPIRSALYWAMNLNSELPHFEPDHGNRFVDDVFVSSDGETLFVSRANLGDIVALDLTRAGFPIKWRTEVKGFNSDHAALSPDGKLIVVSATSAGQVQILETAHGREVASVATGLLPHQNDYSHDGSLIFNSSLGVAGATDCDSGLCRLTVIDAKTFKEVKSFAFPQGIRPMVLAADDRTMYTQLSFLNGLVKFDLTSGKIVGQLNEPLSDFAKQNYPEKKDYPHQSAHHGLAISGDGSKLCDSGTIDNTVSIVSTADLQVRSTIGGAVIPYWATTSVDGRYCFVSMSGDNTISVIDFDSEKEVARLPVGKFPQRSRIGKIPVSTISLLNEN